MIRKRIAAVWAGIAAVAMLAGVESTGIAGAQNAWAGETDPIAVETPSALAQAPASLTDQSVVLTWSKPAGYDKITGYRIYRDGKEAGITSMTYFKVLGLQPEHGYDFTVRAVGADGTLSYQSAKLHLTTMATPKRYNVRDFGALGDGSTKDTAAIQKAIDACKEKNCQVYLPAGTYLSGALNLHSDMSFFVDAGAQLKPSAELADYPFTSARHDIEDVMGRNPAYSSLLNAGEMDSKAGVTTRNIKIMGPGTIGDEANGMLLRKAYDDFTHNGNGGNLDIPSNIYQPGQHVGGGSLISMKNVGGIYLDGIHIRNGMMWTVVPIYSQDITAYGLQLVTSVHNGDGFDPNSSSNVWILGASFSTGDDCSAIKSGKDAEGIAIARPSENIYFRGDVFNSGHGGVTIGSEMSGGVRNVFVEDSTIVPVDLTSGAVNPGIRVKVSPKRGGYVRNIQVRDSVINKISVITNYDRTAVDDLDSRTPLPQTENFKFSHITAPNWDKPAGKDNVIDISGSNFGHGLVKYLKDIRFDDCRFHGAFLDTTQNVSFADSSLTDGLSASRSVNVTRDGKVYKDDGFPVHDDFEAEGASLPKGWKTKDSQTGGGAVVRHEDGRGYLLLDDKGPGYETIERVFSQQQGRVKSSLSFMFPDDPAKASNAVLAYKDSNGKAAASFVLRRSKLVLTGKSGDRTLVNELEAGTWYTLDIHMDTDAKKIDASVAGQGSVTQAPLSDTKAAGVAALEVHMANSNTQEACMALDDLVVESDAAAGAGLQGIELTAPAGVINRRGGSLQVAARLIGPDRSDAVTWQVLRPDLGQTSAAVIDQNGLLQAESNGTVLVTATATDGSGIQGILPVLITNQQVQTGYVPIEVMTTVGVAPVMPTTIYRTLDDGSAMPAKATWGAISADSYSREGDFQVAGSSGGDRVTASVRVSKVAIASIDDSIVKTTPGRLVMPIAVKAVLNDGSRRILPVDWDTVEPSRYASQNIDGFDVRGTVSGAGVKAVARVLVLPANKEGVTPTVVSADGRGDFRSVGEALASIPERNAQRRVIFIKHGIYREKLLIDRPYVTIQGQDPDGTVLTYDDKPTDLGPDGNPLGTYGDYAVKITGGDFVARDIAIQTLAGSTVGQAVALDVNADHASFDNCRILGYQDTLYLQNRTDETASSNPPDQPTVQTNRMYFRNSTIAGSVDFVFGSAIAVFDHCDLHSVLNGYVTAASTPKEQKYGFVFLHSKLTAENPYSGSLKTYLGRPWRPYASVAFIDTSMARHILSEGWNDWGKTSNQSTARFSEYGSTYENDVKPSRVPWAKTLSEQEVSDYTIQRVLARSAGINAVDDWDPTKMVSPTPSPATPITVAAQGSTDQGVTLNATLAPYAQSEDEANLSFKVKDQPQHGLLTMREDGAFSYTPQPGFSGSDRFTFQAFNGAVASNVSTYAITVRPGSGSGSAGTDDANGANGTGAADSGSAHPGAISAGAAARGKPVPGQPLGKADGGRLGRLPAESRDAGSSLANTGSGVVQLVLASAAGILMGLVALIGIAWHPRSGR